MYCFVSIFISRSFCFTNMTNDTRMNPSQSSSPIRYRAATWATTWLWKVAQSTSSTVVGRPSDSRYLPRVASPWGSAGNTTWGRWPAVSNSTWRYSWSVKKFLTTACFLGSASGK
jgi:hypothetical protein